jgi:hypothetical protein
MKDLHSWVQPPYMAELKLTELLDLLLEHGESTASRIAGFEPIGKRVREKILPRAFFVHLQCIIENQLEVGRCGSRVSERHSGEVRS